MCLTAMGKGHPRGPGPLAGLLFTWPSEAWGKSTPVTLVLVPKEEQTLKQDARPVQTQ